MKRCILVLLMTIFALPALAQWRGYVYFNNDSIFIDGRGYPLKADELWLKEITVRDTILLKPGGILKFGDGTTQGTSAASGVDSAWKSITVNDSAIMGDGGIIGLASNKAHIGFDDDTNDEIYLLNALVGVGTSSPDQMLEVYKTNATASIKVTATGGSAKSYFRAYQDDAENYGGWFAWNPSTSNVELGYEYGSGEQTALTISNAGAVGVANSFTAGGTIHPSTDIRYTTELSGDSTYSGRTIVDTVGVAVQAGEFVFLASDGDYELADADLASTMPAVGLVCAAAAANTPATILLEGYYRYNAWNWTVGGQSGNIYMGWVVAGQPVQSLPSSVGDHAQVLGIAIHPDIIYFRPSLDLIEVKE